MSAPIGVKARSSDTEHHLVDSAPTQIAAMLATPDPANASTANAAPKTPPKGSGKAARSRPSKTRRSATSTTERITDQASRIAPKPTDFEALIHALWVRETLRLPAVPTVATPVAPRAKQPKAEAPNSRRRASPPAPDQTPTRPSLPWQPIAQACNDSTASLPCIEDTAPRWTVWLGVAPRAAYEALIKRVIERDARHKGAMSSSDDASDQPSSTVWAVRLSVDSVGRPIADSLDVAPVWLWLAGHEPGNALRQAHTALRRRLGHQIQQAVPSPLDTVPNAAGTPVETSGRPEDSDATSLQRASQIPMAHSASGLEPVTYEALAALFETVVKLPPPTDSDSDETPHGDTLRRESATPKTANRRAPTVDLDFEIAIADWSPALARRGFDERLREVQMLAETMALQNAPTGPRGVRACLLRAPIVQRLIQRPSPNDNGTATRHHGNLFHAAATRLSLLPGGWRPLDQLVDRQRRRLALALSLQPGHHPAQATLANRPEQLFESAQDWNGWPVHPPRTAFWPRPPLLIVTDERDTLTRLLSTLNDCPQLASQARIALADLPSTRGDTSLNVARHRDSNDSAHAEESRRTPGDLAAADASSDPRGTRADPSGSANDDIPTPVLLEDDDERRDNPHARLRDWSLARDALFKSHSELANARKHTAGAQPSDTPGDPSYATPGRDVRPGEKPNSTAQHDLEGLHDPLPEPLRNAFDTIASENPELETFARGVAYRLAPVEKSLQLARKHASQIEQRLARQSQRWEQRLQRLRARLVEVETDIRQLDIECQDIAERLAEVQHRSRPQWLGRLSRAIGLRSKSYQDWQDTCEILRERLAATNDQIRAIEPLERRLRRLIGRCQSRRHRERADLESAFIAAGETLAREQSRFRALIERQKERFEALRAGDRSVLPASWPPRGCATDGEAALPEIDDIWGDDTTDPDTIAMSTGPAPEAVRAILAQLGFPPILSFDHPANVQPDTGPRHEQDAKRSGDERSAGCAAANAAHESSSGAQSNTHAGSLPDAEAASAFFALTCEAVEPMQRLNLRALDAHLLDPHHHPLTIEQRRMLWRGLSLDYPIVVASSAFARRHLADLGEQFFEHVVIDGAETRSPAEISLLATLGVSVSLRFTGQDRLRWADVSRWSDTLLERPTPQNPMPEAAQKASRRASAKSTAKPKVRSPKVRSPKTTAIPQRVWLDTAQHDGREPLPSEILGLLDTHTPASDVEVALDVIRHLSNTLPADTTLLLTAPFKGSRETLSAIAQWLEDQGGSPQTKVDSGTPSHPIKVVTPDDAAQRVTLSDATSAGLVIVAMLGTAPGEAGEGSRRWAAAGDKRLRGALKDGAHRLIVIGRHDDWGPVLGAGCDSWEVSHFGALGDLSQPRE